MNGGLVVKNPPANAGDVGLEDPQYVSKFGKLSGGHKTGKGQFSFQSQRKTMSKNAQTTAQLHLFHMLGK